MNEIYEGFMLKRSWSGHSEATQAPIYVLLNGEIRESWKPRAQIRPSDISPATYIL